jgi:hypothetical protein
VMAVVIAGLLVVIVVFVVYSQYHRSPVCLQPAVAVAVDVDVVVGAWAHTSCSTYYTAHPGPHSTQSTPAHTRCV